MPGFGHWSLIYIYISEKTNNDFIDNRLRIEKQSKMSEKIEKNEEPIKRDAKKAGRLSEKRSWAGVFQMGALRMRQSLLIKCVRDKN